MFRSPFVYSVLCVDLLLTHIQNYFMLRLHSGKLWLIKMIRLDDLHIGGLKIYQDSDSFCFGTDAVLLAWFAGSRKFAAAADLCSGTGIVPILLSRHKCMKTAVCVELDVRQAELVRISVAYNGLEDKISVKNCDLRLIKSEKLLENAVCDLVTANPPYSALNTGFVSAGAKGSARTELCCTVADIAAQSAYLLKNGGRLCVVYKPERLCDLICACREEKLELKRLQTVSARMGGCPVMILAEFIKRGRSGTVIEPPLVIYNENNEYTDVLNKIYGRGAESIES